MSQTVVTQDTRTKKVRYGTKSLSQVHKDQRKKGRGKFWLINSNTGVFTCVPNAIPFTFFTKKSFNVQSAKEKAKTGSSLCERAKVEEYIGKLSLGFPSQPAFKSWPFHDKHLIYTWDCLKKWSSFWSSSSRPSLPSLTGKSSREIIKSSEIWLYVIYLILWYV